MAFVKLDCGILDSTLWVDREAREVFITALLMAEPRELTDPEPQLEVKTLELTGFQIPSGWYGFVPAAGTGIIRRSGVNQEDGLSALERLSAPDAESRTPDFDGRRVARIDGGYIILNFDRYRQKDHTASERSRRHRERKKQALQAVASRVTNVTQRVASRSVTQAEAEAEAEAEAIHQPVPVACKGMQGGGIEPGGAAALPLHAKKVAAKVAFSPPTQAEAQAHAVKIGMPMDEVEGFLAHGEKTGWTIGPQYRVRLKSWHAAMVTWKRNNEKYQRAGNRGSRITEAERRQIACDPQRNGGIGDDPNDPIPFS